MKGMVGVKIKENWMKHLYWNRMVHARSTCGNFNFWLKIVINVTVMRKINEAKMFSRVGLTSNRIFTWPSITIWRLGFVFDPSGTFGRIGTGGHRHRSNHTVLFVWRFIVHNRQVFLLISILDIRWRRVCICCGERCARVFVCSCGCAEQPWGRR